MDLGAALPVQLAGFQVQLFAELTETMQKNCHILILPVLTIWNS